MKATCILALCFLAFLLGEAVATTAETRHHKHHHHHHDSPSQPELLQTQSQTTTEATTATATGTETGCSPDCILNYPYNEGGCSVSVNEEAIIPPVVIITEEEGTIVIPPPEEWVVTTNEEIPRYPVEETIIYSGEDEIVPNYEGEWSNPIPEQIIIITDEEGTIYLPPDETYTSSNEETTPIIPHEEYVIYVGEGGEDVFPPKPEPEPECVYTASLSSGITHAYGQPTTYLTYVVHDSKVDQDVTYTYVLTTMYSGTVQTDTNDYVVYGTGAINFYNTYYGVSDYLTDNPGCSCVCGYSSYTFSYSFDF